MRRLLWIGDAVVASGFARATHHTLEVLRKTWDVSVLGLNYLGDPHQYPYPIFPAFSGGDAFGIKRTASLVEQLQPDVVVIQNDPWNIPSYVREIQEASSKTAIVASLPVDGKNCRGTLLNGLNLGVFWTEFGLAEAKLGGFRKDGIVIPLGVDLDMYKPMDRLEARLAAGLPPELENAFIVGNVNRNQPRKRLDLTIKYFSKWILDAGIEDAYLYLHVAPTGDLGYDVQQLMGYHGGSSETRKRLILAEPDIGHGIPEKVLAASYSVFDIQITTTQGEGWGLTTMEGMACGVPQIVPVWAALGEWTEEAPVRIFCNATIATPDRINVIGGVPCERTFIAAMDHLYRSTGARAKRTIEGLRVVQKPQYRWENIGQRFAEALEQFTPAKAAA